ncbi:MAG: methyl-accepting chemotaxis protein [Alphaproteobacteria bacterium]|nr:methyl-accepting chemotaxis protein [Alphaproteobacteria bacterium]
MGDGKRGNRGRLEFGIGATLYTATGLLILLTIAAAGLSFWAFSSVERTLTSVTGQSFPAVKDGLNLTILSERMAAKAPELIRANDPAEREAVSTEIAADLAGINAVLDRIRANDPDRAASVASSVDILAARMEDLKSAIDRREMARATLANLRSRANAIHGEFFLKMGPLIEEENFGMVLAGGEAVANASRSLNELVTVHVDGLKAVFDAALLGEQMLAVMIRNLTGTSQKPVSQAEEQFLKMAEELRALVDRFPETENAVRLAAAVEAIVAVGIADDTPFTFRAASTSGGGNALIQSILNNKIVDASANFSRAVGPVVADAQGELAGEGKRLSGSLRGEINGLMEEDVFALTQTMFLMSEANLMVGMLNAAAGSPDLDELATYNSKFFESSYRMNGYTVDLEFLGKAEEVISLAKSLGAIGDGDDSLFAVRERLLNEELLALEALGAAQQAAQALDREVSASVADAERSVDAGTAATIGMLKQTETVLIGMAVAGIVAGLLIGWLVIYRRVVKRLVTLAGQMGRLAEGDNSVEPNAAGHDEIAGMARTVVVFRDNALEVEKLRQEQVEAEERAQREAERQRFALADQFEEQVKDIVERLSAASDEMEKNALLMTDGANDVQSRSNTGASAAEATASNVQAMAAAVEELSASIREISGKVSESSRMAQTAAAQADQTNRSMQGLEEAAARIDSVVALIQDIAEQTNLLALNATIEAARAGDAGKGFAVVASEVKNLAGQTATATEEITQQIKTLQAGVSDAAGAIKQVSGVIQDIGGHVTSIAGAVEQQNASTEEIARSSRDAAEGTNQVSETVGSLSDVATKSGHQADAVLNAARSLSQETRDLGQAVDVFLGGIRKGA